MKAIWVATLLAVLPCVGEAQKSITVGIPTAQFNFVSAAQLRTEWCWAASIQMVLNWYNVPVKQSDVVDRIYGKPLDAAASEDAIARALSGTAFNRSGRKVILSAQRKHGVPPATTLIDQLASRRPMLITIQSRPNMLHAVVLTSAEYIDTGKGVHISALTYRDPNPTFRGRHPAGTIRVEGTALAKFVRSISSYYMVAVHS